MSDPLSLPSSSLPQSHSTLKELLHDPNIPDNSTIHEEEGHRSTKIEITSKR